MKHTTIIFVLFVSIAASAATLQSPNLNPCAHAEHMYQRLISSAAGSTEPEQQVAQRSVAQQKLQQFWLKTERFIDAWTALAREYNEKGTFNVKKAREVSKAFHVLEKSEGWAR